MRRTSRKRTSEAKESPEGGRKSSDHKKPVTISRYRVALLREEGWDLELPGKCDSAESVVDFFHLVLGDFDREVFAVLFLDGRYRPTGYHIAAIGTHDRCTISPAEVFRAALLKVARRIILFHNHPTGDPKPSPQDYAATRRFVDAGRIIGIPVKDHVIVGEDGAWVSVRKRLRW